MIIVKIIVENTNRLISKELIFFGNLIVCTKAAAPNAKKTLAKLEPSILPIAAPGLPSILALKETNNSGAEVPNATSVPAMIKGETFKILDISTAPLTNISPENASISSPKIK
tara:strand:+ start:81 stop:419 length:339 start_codon:yes stop_codon:yes gene_type:complete